jgi:hypothetical protein
MAETPNAEVKSWWQTLPGILTAFAAAITAVTGLIVAVRPARSPAESRPPIETSSTGASGATTGASVTSPPSTTTQGRSTPATAQAIRPPSPSQVKLARGDIVIDILRGRVEPYNATTRSLALRIRLTNNGNYGVNFWASSFRLVIDGVPRAPTNGLNEIVDGHAAKDGDVIFDVPDDARSVALRLVWSEEQTDVPLDLPPP